MRQTLPTEQLDCNLSFYLSEPRPFRTKGSESRLLSFVENDLTVSRDLMPRGVYNAGRTRWTRISKREQRSLHAGLLGGMCTQRRNEIKNNPNLDPIRFPGPLTRMERERQYVARDAQCREDFIVTRAVERELEAVASGRVAVGPAGFF